jgi:hypothetical protein
MEWKWPAEHNVDCKDYHPEYGGGKVATNGNYGGIAKACDSLITGSYDDTYHSLVGLNSGHIDFIFTFEDANTWCSGYRQMGSNALGAEWAPKSYTKKIEIYTGDANFGPWTLVATDTHSTWDNGRTPTFTDDGTTTEWTPTAPSKYLLVRTLTNHGDRGYGGRLVVRFLQLKFSSSPPSPSPPLPSPSQPSPPTIAPPLTGVITTVIPSGQFIGPFGIAIDPSGSYALVSVRASPVCHPCRDRPIRVSM